MDVYSTPTLRGIPREIAGAWFNRYAINGATKQKKCTDNVFYAHLIFHYTLAKSLTTPPPIAILLLFQTKTKITFPLLCVK